MELKYLTVPLQLKADGLEGTVQALFSVFNMLDSDGDVVEPSFFTDGQPIPMAAWGHSWDSLPPGKGTIRVAPEGAVFDGEFFTDTTHGLDHYRTVKHLGGLQEWSFGFRVLEAVNGEFNGQPARFLRKGETFEASPVLVGANRETRTLAIKAAQDTSTKATDESPGLSYADEAERTLAAVSALLARSKSLADLRAKEGRTFSAANVTRLQTIMASVRDAMAEMEGMLGDAAPKSHVGAEFWKDSMRLAQRRLALMEST